jgi:hypothetical protein
MSGWPCMMWSPGLACSQMPAPCDLVLLVGATGSQPPGSDSHAVGLKRGEGARSRVR